MMRRCARSLIPIRGTLPWENCTSGAFLNASCITPTPSSRIVDDQISWTEDSASDEDFGDWYVSLNTPEGEGSLWVGVSL